MTDFLDDIIPGAERLGKVFQGRSPSLAVVLGSGFSAIVSALTDVISVPYADLPGFAPAGVQGHAGVVYCGRLFGQEVLVFSGRYHVYEGYSAWQVTALVRLAARLGCKRLLLTNAVGGISDAMSAGDFMLVADHINLTGLNPFIGRSGAGFPDLHNLYRTDFFAELKAQVLAASGVVLHAGTLAWLPGPTYETPAEIRMLEILGCHAVSMSTVPEAIVAKTLNLDLVALSFVANKAAGKCPQPLTHDEVLREAKRVQDKASMVVRQLLDCWN